jgi:N-acetylglucosamine-6-phosphate deacetylase
VNERHGWILTGRGLRRGTVRYGRTLLSVELQDNPPTSGPSGAPIILPGFIDTHVHGGAGADTMDGSDAVLTLARHHLSHGTTTLYPTTLTAPMPEVLAALNGVKDAIAAATQATAPLPSLPGVHLEGPFISPQRLGAQPAHAMPPTALQVATVLAPGVVRLVTLAPEASGALQAAKAFAEAGVRVSVGHTVATAEQVGALYDTVRAAGGTVGFTHLYNAMGGLAGREPGAVGASLAHQDAYAELILDGHHVHTTAFLAARNAKPHTLHLVTDAMRACGLPEGQTSHLGGQPVTVQNGAARLEDGTLAGSVLTMDQALRNAVHAGLSVEAAAHHASAVPAAYMGLADRGRIEPGLRADLVVLDDNLHVQETVAAGTPVPREA